MGVIPKKIHYCWFGGNPKNELLIKCIETWKLHFPDYEIIEWNESNYDVSKNTYCEEAYLSKKWAFVSDYARLDIIYNHGGIYFDTDVEVIKNFEHLIQEKGYLCFENNSNKKNEKNVNTGLGFAAKPQSQVIKGMLQEYEDVHFISDNKTDMTSCPIRNTAALVKLGLNTDGTFQTIDDINIYPFDYFCGFDIANGHEKITENTYTIHHYAGLWKDPPTIYEKIRYGMMIPWIRRILGNDRYDRLKIKLKNR